MFISINSVSKRANGLKDGTKYTMTNEFNYNILKENMKTTTNPIIVEKFIGSWDYEKNYAKRSAFRDMLKVVKEFCLRDDITQCLKNKAISTLSSNALYTFGNAKQIKEIVNEVFSDNTVQGIEPLLEEIDLISACDRVLNNKKRLDNFVSLDSTAKRYVINKISLQECIENMCDQINTFKMPFKVKYNVALENVLYTFKCNDIKCDRSTILEGITDYFLMKNDKKENIDDISNIVERTCFYTDIDKEGVRYLLDKANKKHELDSILYNDEYYTENVKDIVKKKLNPVKKSMNKLANSNVFDELKIMFDKSPENVKKVIYKLYVKSPEQIIQELPNILSWFRTALVLGTFSISPYLGIISLGVDKFIQLSLQRHNTEQAIKIYNKELEKSKVKLEKLDINSKAYSNCEAYIVTLKKNIKKLEDYQYTLKSEKELDENMIYNSNDPEIQDILNNIDTTNLNLTDSQKIYLDVEQNTADVNEYLEIDHKRVVANITNAMRKYKETLIVNTQFNKLARQGYFTSIDDDEFDRFKLANSNTIEDYIGGDNKIFFCIGFCLPLRTDIPKYRDRETISYLLDTLTNIIQNACDDSINVLYEGDDEDIYRIYLSYMKPIELQEEVSESIMHIDARKDIALVLALENTLVNFSGIDSNKLAEMINENIYKYDNDVIEGITDLAIAEPEIINKDELIYILKNEKNRNYSMSESAGKKYARGSIINNCIDKLNKFKPKVHKESTIDTIECLLNINEAVALINEYNVAVNETSIKTNTKIIAQKIKSKAAIINDKQKQASKQLDNMVDKFQNSIQKDLSNKNREAVIKGRLLPSASAIIKLALTSGVVGMVNPVLGVITALGGIGAAAAGTKKEKQYILDEIDIQLEIVKKKEQLAESNNDMKALEELMKIERKLTRERARILYRIRNYYPVVSR